MTSEATESPMVPELTAGRGRGPGGQLTGLTTHAYRCPIPRCDDLIDPSRLMCRRHWYRVPKQLRDQVWATWRSGHGNHSSEHQDAVRMAIAACQDGAVKLIWPHCSLLFWPRAKR
jgi:hypothetical protein